MRIINQTFLEIKKNYLVFVTVILLTFLTKGLAVSVPFFLKTVVDSLIYDANWTTSFDVSASIVVLMYVLVFFISGFSDELREFLSEKSIQPALARVFQKIYTHVLQLPISFYLDNKSGSLLRDLDRGMRGLQSLTSIILYSFVPLVLEIALVIVLLLIQHEIQYAAIVFLGIAAHISITIISSEKLTFAREKLNKSDSKIGGHISETMSNFETIKIFSSSKYEASVLARLFKTYIQEVISFQFIYSQLKVIQRAIIALTIGAILFIAAQDVMVAKITPGDFILLNALAMQLLLPISSMGILWKEFRQGIVDVKNLSEIYEININQRKSISYQPLEIAPSIAFKDISYEYPNGKIALRNISFKVKSGQFVAVVGLNGSGKTTLLRLLLGLISQKSGEIYFDEKHVLEEDIQSLREYFGVVPQNVTLFHGTILENMTYGAENIDFDFVVSLAKELGIHDDITSNFPNGYETQVGQSGLKLSGGERQKIGLVRALLKNPKFVILDEPSSSLDSDSEVKIFGPNSKIFEDKTVLMVTHKTNLLEKVDLVLHLSNGVLIESGKHSDLMEISSEYRKLCSTIKN